MSGAATVEHDAKEERVVVGLLFMVINYDTGPSLPVGLPAVPPEVGRLRVPIAAADHARAHATATLVFGDAKGGETAVAVWTYFGPAVAGEMVLEVPLLDGALAADAADLLILGLFAVLLSATTLANGGPDFCIDFLNRITLKLRVRFDLALIDSLCLQVADLAYKILSKVGHLSELERLVLRRGPVELEGEDVVVVLAVVDAPVDCEVVHLVRAAEGADTLRPEGDKSETGVYYDVLEPL